MTLARFTIVEKVINGYSIEGFILEDEDGKRQPVNVETATKLARAEKIDGAEAILDSDTGSYILHISKKLNDIQTNRNISDRVMTLTARILDADGRCIGYKAKDHTGKDYKLSINKAWKLAVNDSIHGIKAVVLNGYKVMISEDGSSLNNLPKLS